MAPEQRLRVRDDRRDGYWCYRDREPVEVIVTHDVSDFDGIASSVAALKLYPGARMLRRRIWPREVRAFMERFGERFCFEPLQDCDPEAIERLILVDVRRRSRLLPDLRAVLERIDAGSGPCVHVYDHHPESPDDVRGDLEVVDPLGAVSTAFVEMFRDRRISVDALEATLLALGIYSDTGNLTYDVTTARDADAVAWLLRQGADLTQMSEFLRPNFGPRQRELLSQMLGAMQIHSQAGVNVGISIVPLRRSVSGMPVVTTHVCQLSDARVVFGIFPVGRHRVQIIGRCDHAPLDIGAVLKRLGGGGNADAGAATLRDLSGDAAKDKLLEALEAQAAIESASARERSPEG